MRNVSPRRAFVTGACIGLLICNMVAAPLMAAPSCPPETAPVLSIAYGPAVVWGSDKTWMTNLNQYIYAGLFGIPGSEGEMMLLDSAPACGFVGGSDQDGRPFQMTIAGVDAVPLDPNDPSLDQASRQFMSDVNLEIHAVAGIAETALAAFWTAAFVFSMDTPTGRKHLLAFGEAAPYVNGVVVLPKRVSSIEEQGRGGPDETQEKETCQDLLNKCRDNYNASADSCAAAAILCALAAAACLVGLAWSGWICVATLIGCKGFMWLTKVCAAGLASCLASVAACYAKAEIAYMLCKSRALNDPRCEGIAWE